MRLSLALFILFAAVPACGGSSEPEPVEPVPAPGPQAAAPEPAAEPAAETPEDAELLAAAGAYTRKNSAKGLEFSLRIQAREGDFALLVVEPKREEADAALLFMKREASGWKGLSLGTGIDCSDVADDGVPASLCSSLR